MGYRYSKCAVVAKVAGADHQIKGVQQIKTVDTVIEFNAHQGAIFFEQRAGSFMLGMTGQSWIINLADFRMSTAEVRKCKRVITGLIEAQAKCVCACG